MNRYHPPRYPRRLRESDENNILDVAGRLVTFVVMAAALTMILVVLQ